MSTDLRYSPLAQQMQIYRLHNDFQTYPNCVYSHTEHMGLFWINRLDLMAHTFAALGFDDSFLLLHKANRMVVPLKMSASVILWTCELGTSNSQMNFADMIEWRREGSLGVSGWPDVIISTPVSEKEEPLSDAVWEMSHQLYLPPHTHTL